MSKIFSETEQRRIAAQSRTLLERLSDPDAFEYDIDDATADDLVEAWRERYPDDESFHRRLDREEFSQDELRRAACVDTLAEGEEIPAWVDRLDALAAAIESHSPDEFPENLIPNPEQWVHNEREKPFGALSAVVAEYAREQLGDVALEVLSDDTIGIMQEWFRVRFETRFSRILYVEFKTYVAAHDQALARADPDEFSERPTTYYDQFIEALFSGAFPSLCLEYPVFARLLTTQIRQWDEHLEEFSRRLQADRELLAERFTEDGDLGDVVEIYSLADDTHGDGRAIMRVEFESGVTVAYKPRSVGAGAAFYDTLADLDEQLPVTMGIEPTYVRRDGYGWMEWIERRDCRTERDVERYYRRAGALSCLTYFFEFTDCHLENLVSAGSTPALVDAETIFHPYIGPDRSPMPTGVQRFVRNNVLLSLLLPYEIGGSMAELGGGDTSALMAGIGISDDDATLTHVSSPHITAVNTDVMAVERDHPAIDRSDNVPKVDGRGRPPDEYVTAVTTGFEETYRSILELRDSGALFDEIELFDRFSGVENRIVYRPTQVYATLLQKLCSRASLSDGFRFGVAMEELAVPFCDGTVSGDVPWKLYDSERVELRRLDPPRFTSETDRTEIEFGGEPTGVDAGTSGISRSRDRIESASIADMNTQLELIRGALGAKPDPSPDLGGAIRPDESSIDETSLRSEAAALFERIRRLGSSRESEELNWTWIESIDTTDRLTIHPFDETLHVGTGGVALLSASLYQLTGEDRYATVARDVIEPTLRSVRSAQVTPSMSKHGGVTGIGSVIYGIATVGAMLGDEATLRTGVQAARSIGTDAVGPDTQYDVAGGAAGTILGLLALDERYESDELVSIATECGDELLANRSESEGGYRVWHTIDECPPLTGFLHGASGIAYSLTRLYEATGDEAYLSAAIEAVEFEAQQYSERASNWRDRRPWVDDEFTDRWSYGRTGIGLSRLGMRAATDHELVERDLSRALDGIDADELLPVDDLADGNCGRVEFLNATARRTERRVETPETALEGCLARKATNGTFRTSDEQTYLANPSFLGGLAGISYTLLRVVESESLPCVLLFE
ncbi:type 2 lanthipeptide synthetase LanM family protein [Natrinema longum]|uniref:Type 2 lantipeptide synthetase LanM family protein n=1 Tax=Natrinema longum TaxID=370324 RepID=A0A8A2UBP3_9EURY|nr:type 2 lanthipeptide synthetase LanM family protein [Natrinema longum]MBZ6496163.1 type 2 lantipeptide synthetase LanM family protein [Natrinema longum]QSW85912.1 type 2 lantipeptide synthetase LanM family protein [Natrinema longum]